MIIPTEPIGSIPRPGYPADYLGTDGLGCTDDCGFSPFGDDVSTARDTAFAKVRARVDGAKLAGDRLG